MEYQGHLCLAVTPFAADGVVDLESLDRLLGHLIDGGVSGVIVLGSTGEFFSLLPEERRAVVERAVGVCGSRGVGVVVGVGAPGTEESVRYAIEAKELGAQAVMVPPAFYATDFFSTVAGIELHLSRVAEAAAPLGVMLYDGGGGIEIPLGVIGSLVEAHPNVSAVKLTVPKPQKVGEIRRVTEDRLRILCGNDALTPVELRAGVDGVAIGVGNVVPDHVSRVVADYRDGRAAEGRERFYERVLPVAAIALASTPEFVQVFKLGLTRMGILASDRVRLPLVPLDETRIAESLAALSYVGVLPEEASGSR